MCCLVYNQFKEIEKGEKTIENELGQYLEKVRQNKQLALRDVAEISGLGHTYIRDLELGINRKTGKNITPSSETIKKIAEAYDLDYYDLLDKAGIIDLASLITLRDDKKKTEKKTPFIDSQI